MLLLVFVEVGSTRQKGKKGQRRNEEKKSFFCLSVLPFTRFAFCPSLSVWHRSHLREPSGKDGIFRILGELFGLQPGAPP